MQSLKDPWRQMIAINAGIMLGLYLYKLLYSIPQLQYLHLIIDYHFGFAKRALIGTLVSSLLPTVPVWFVFVLGGAVWLLALVLFLRLFVKTFGFNTATLPLFVFIFGSPFFLKNFIHAIGYFDIYGCVFALIMLLIPARSFFYVVVGALGCMVLILVHHLHMLLYIPTVGLIVVMRYYFTRGVTTFNLVGGIALAGAVGTTFILTLRYGAMPVSMEQLIPYLRERTADKNYPLSPQSLDIWYRPIGDDMRRTRHVFLENMLRSPVYVALIALHWPLIRYFAGLVRALADGWQRRIVIFGVAGVSLGYLVICAIAFDYPRWVASWAVCMFLILHAVKMLPAHGAVPLIARDDKWARILGWMVTAVPRLGINKPF